MSNPYYTATGAPAARSPGSSAVIRAELAMIAAAFDKFPALVGNAGKLLRVNAGATGIEAVAGHTFTDAITGTSAAFSGGVSATTFTGALNGNATTATSATTAGHAGTATTATTATSATSASTAGSATKAARLLHAGIGSEMTFNWTEKPGQPPWVWGGEDGVNHYVYNPSLFSVAHATTAGTASSASAVAWTGVSGRPSALSQFTNDPGFYASGSSPSFVNINASGAITASGNITAYSDERLKHNWRGFGADFIERLANVKRGVYDRTDVDLTQVGVSAQSLREVLPQAVIEDAAGRLSVAYGSAALAACVELARAVVELRGRA